MQAITDSNYKFMYLSISCVGSTHDALAFASSKLFDELSAGALPEALCLVGDEAYVAINWLLTPIAASRAPTGSASDC